MVYGFECKSIVAEKTLLKNENMDIYNHRFNWSRRFVSDL